MNAAGYVECPHRCGWRISPGLDYEGALGFLETTWDQFKPKGYPDGAHQATKAQQLTVGRRLVARFGGYSSWPACHRRLGLPG